MECVNFVLQYVNSSNLELLVPRLIDLIKSSPGLVTKAGTANLINNLTNQCPLDLQPFTGITEKKSYYCVNFSIAKKYPQYQSYS